MTELLVIFGLFGSGMSIGLIFGALLQEWRLNRAFEVQENSCENCVHGDLEWDEEPCDTCHDHCAWEAITNANENN